MFSIVICRQSGDKWQSKTVSNEFYLPSSTVLEFSIDTYPVCDYDACHPGQLGGTECGVFAIAFAVAFCFGLNPTKLIFDQSKLRTHLITCLSKKNSNFPFSINTNWKKRKQINIKEKCFAAVGVCMTAK